MSYNTLRKRFQRDIRFLEKNEIPMESYGDRIHELDYKIEKDNDEE
jgi:hypothetical protein